MIIWLHFTAKHIDIKINNTHNNSWKYQLYASNIHQNQPNLTFIATMVGIFMGFFASNSTKYKTHKIHAKHNNFTKSDNYARNGGPFMRYFWLILQIMGESTQGRHLRCLWPPPGDYSLILSIFLVILTFIAIMVGIFRWFLQHFLSKSTTTRISFI